MLDDSDGGSVELGDTLERGVGVVQVVVGQFLALHLHRRRHAGPLPRTIKRRRLMRVFAIPQRLPQGSGQCHSLWKHLLALRREPRPDGGIVGRGARVGLPREPPAQQQRRAAGPGQRFQYFGVLTGVGQHRHEIMVLRRAADQRRPADIDVLDTVIESGPLRDRRLKRIQVDRHQIDRRDPMRPHLLHVFGHIPPPQDAAMDLRHQRLDAAVHDFGEPGVVGHLGHLHPGRPQRLRRSAGGQDLHAAIRQGAGKRHQPGFVGNGDQGPADGNDVGHGGGIQ